MRVCGFTIIRNAVKYDYPVVESITSVLPVCDEFLVLVGNSDDGTADLIRSIGSAKIRIEHSTWDDSLREGGRVLAAETNKAMDLIPAGFDWIFYIQADEVVHEQYHTAIRNAMQQWQNDPEVDGLLFEYTHFYGTYGYVADSRKWYRNEVRIVRNDRSIRAYRDAQGFRKDGRKLRVKPSGGAVFHYGWVKNPATMQAKMHDFHLLWHDEEWLRKNFRMEELFDYSQVDSISRFEGSHPAVMMPRVKSLAWNVKLDTSRKKFGLKAALLYYVEKITGKRLFEYKNYSLLK